MSFIVIKRLFFSILICFNITTSVFSQNYSDGHNIKISVDDWTDSVSYLGYYIGSKTYLEDTAMVSNGTVVFKGEKNLSPGMYFLYTPNSLFFEFLVNGDNFSLSTKIDEVTAKMQVSNSRENELFFNYQRKIGLLQVRANKLGEELKNISGQDSIRTLNEIRDIGAEVQEMQRVEQNRYSGTYYSEVLSLMLRPDKIEVPEGVAEDNINSYRLNEYKNRYWDGTNFNNPGTIRNPLFENKLDEYFEKLVYSFSDSIVQEIESLLSQKMDTVVYRYIIVNLTNKYATSKLMGMDAVYVHMVDNYYSTGKAYWIDEVTLARMQQNCDRIRPILIGKQAPLFKSESLDGKSVLNPFTITDKDYKIIFFYDSGCGHCKKAIPKLMESFHALRQAEISADLISMNLSEDVDEWKKFIEEHKVEGKILGDTKGISNAGYYYYVDSTPQIYVMDKENKIIAKKIQAEFVDDFLKDYVKQQ